MQSGSRGVCGSIRKDSCGQAKIHFVQFKLYKKDYINKRIDNLKYYRLSIII